MNSRSKVVDVKGTKYELRRLPPEVGSFIFMRMLGIAMKMRAENPPKEEPQETEDRPKPDAEAQVRALSFVVQSGGMGFEDFKFVQQSCMKSVSVIEGEPAVPMPIMTDGGEWTKNGASLAVDVASIMQITTEMLVFCFSDFFDAGIPGT